MQPHVARDMSSVEGRAWLLLRARRSPPDLPAGRVPMAGLPSKARAGPSLWSCPGLVLLAIFLFLMMLPLALHLASVACNPALRARAGRVAGPTECEGHRVREEGGQQPQVIRSTQSWGESACRGAGAHG